jgi:hypothetical protein
MHLVQLISYYSLSSIRIYIPGAKYKKREGYYFYVNDEILLFRHA